MRFVEVTPIYAAVHRYAAIKLVVIAMSPRLTSRAFYLPGQYPIEVHQFHVTGSERIHFFTFSGAARLAASKNK